MAIIQFIDATFLGDEANNFCQTSFFSVDEAIPSLP